MNKYIYSFNQRNAEGNKNNKTLLGGKGANLAEMTNLGIPVPPGFTITTEVCTHYYNNQYKYPDHYQQQLISNIEILEKVSGKKFGDSKNPLLVSVRSGAAVSMPGMMDTILNLGLNDETTAILAEQTKNIFFAYDSYRRFIQMFANVAMGIDINKFEIILNDIKKNKNVEFDHELEAKDIQIVIEKYKEVYQKEIAQKFPQDCKLQLQKAISAVFTSWMNPRAIYYRKINHLSDTLGTAVNIQSMVFGNMGSDSGTGVVFTRSPSSGEKIFFGEFLINAQGEDVVAGIRTPVPIDQLKAEMPTIFSQLKKIASNLEKHYQNMQDIEFTIEKGKLFLLQTRNAKRTAFAAIRTAVEMQKEGLIDRKSAVLQIDPKSFPSLLAKIFDEKSKSKAVKNNLIIAQGLAAGPGAATGQIVLTSEKVEEMYKCKIPTILVRSETSPEDISGMYLAQGILTSRGGMTSHAAVVARGMNKPCIVGCSEIEVDYKNNIIRIKTPSGEYLELKEGDWISIDGFSGEVIHEKIPTIQSEIEQVLVDKKLPLEKSLITQYYCKLIEWAKEFSSLKVRANADTGEDARIARLYGAEGIGLCRTEHMFFDKDRILSMRKIILAPSTKERGEAIHELLFFQKEDFKKIFYEMSGFPVTIRLLDPPLHEFLPHDEDSIHELASSLNRDIKELRKKINELQEFNPMLGHRGCRLGITYPEITKMQVRAILEAACDLIEEGISVLPEVMVPLVGHYKELANQSNIIHQVADEIQKERGVNVDYLVGTMIEVPRAAITADEIAEITDFFSFGTNDLTQMGAGFSRDDCQTFLPVYVELGIYDHNPFEVLDQKGIGQLIEYAIKKGKSKKENIKLGICGEHGGDPASIHFFHKIGLNYVSCSPYRVPVAQIAAAQAALNDE